MSAGLFPRAVCSRIHPPILPLTPLLPLGHWLLWVVLPRLPCFLTSAEAQPLGGTDGCPKAGGGGKVGFSPFSFGIDFSIRTTIEVSLCLPLILGIYSFCGPGPPWAAPVSVPLSQMAPGSGLWPHLPPPSLWPFVERLRAANNVWVPSLS